MAVIKNILEIYFRKLETPPVYRLRFCYALDNGKVFGADLDTDILIFEKHGIKKVRELKSLKYDEMVRYAKETGIENFNEYKEIIKNMIDKLEITG